LPLAAGHTVCGAISSPAWALDHLILVGKRGQKGLPQPSPLDKKVGKVMALRGDGLSYLADWPLGMSPTSAVAIVRGDGVGSNESCCSPRSTWLSRRPRDDHRRARGAGSGPCWSPTISISSVPRPTGIANDRHPPQQRERNSISDKRLMFFVGNLSVSYGLLPGSYIISR
jgi:hypothetical protein